MLQAFEGVFNDKAVERLLRWFANTVWGAMGERFVAPQVSLEVDSEAVQLWFCQRETEFIAGAPKLI